MNKIDEISIKLYNEIRRDILKKHPELIEKNSKQEIDKEKESDGLDFILNYVPEIDSDRLDNIIKDKSKNEKINVLRRFDSVESLKESKALYKTIKDELGNQGGTTVVKESFQHKIEKTPASGSAINLMESKTYENPQFMRMKDLMTKMNVVK
jgi:hypothetical protein